MTAVLLIKKGTLCPEWETLFPVSRMGNPIFCKGDLFSQKEDQVSWKGDRAHVFDKRSSLKYCSNRKKHLTPDPSLWKPGPPFRKPCFSIGKPGLPFGKPGLTFWKPGPNIWETGSPFGMILFCFSGSLW